MKYLSGSKSMMFWSRHKDLDWYQHSAMAPRTPQKCSWQCGNRLKRKQAVSHFAKYSSLHGVHFICSNDSKTSRLKKIFFRLFFGFCMLSTLSNVLFLTQESWVTQSVYISTTSKEGSYGAEEDPLFPRHPRITFCRRPGYRIHENDDNYQELVEYAYIALGYPFVSLTPEETSFMIEIKAFKMRHPGEPLPPHLDAMESRLHNMKERYDQFKSREINFNLTQFIEDNSARREEIFIRCIILVFHLNCTEFLRPILTSLGTCYHVLLGEIVKTIDSIDLETTLIFDLHAAPQLDKALDVGYQIYLSDPRNIEGMINAAREARLLNGYTTVVKSSLTKTSRSALFTPWYGMYTKCPSLPPELDPLNYGERFFKVACEKRYLERLIKRQCQCKILTDLSMSSEVECDPEKIYNCFVTYALFDNLTGMGHSCGFPCIEYGYDTEVSLVKLGDENISRLVFIYDGKQYSLREYRTTTLSSFLSQIGGALGLYLGASIITVVEMVNFAATWLWYTCAPSKRKSGSVAIHRKEVKKQQYFY